MSDTKFKKATVNVTDNGYTVFFSDHTSPYGEGWYVAKTLDEVKKILATHFIRLKS